MTQQTPGNDPLSTTFAALADPTRRAILARLARGEATVTELAAPFDMSLPGISKHLRVLQRAGLIEQGRQAQWRPCRLQPEPLKGLLLHALDRVLEPRRLRLQGPRRGGIGRVAGFGRRGGGEHRGDEANADTEEPSRAG